MKSLKGCFGALIVMGVAAFLIVKIGAYVLGQANGCMNPIPGEYLCTGMDWVIIITIAVIFVGIALTGIVVCLSAVAGIFKSA